MTKILKSILTIILLSLISCGPKLQSNSGEVNFLYKDAEGSIAVKSVGYGTNRENAVIDAQKNAFKILLFRGIPGTDLNVPLIDNENEAKLKNTNYFKNFFEEGNYKTFMMSSTESSNLVKVNGVKKIVIDIKINYNSLRKNLEQNQLVRKFGY